MDTGESAQETVKAIAQGRPDCFGVPVVTNSCGSFTPTRGCGCTKHPAFPAPSRSAQRMAFKPQDPGASRRGNAGAYPWKGPFRPLQEADRPCLLPAKLCFGNRILTLISVWLEAKSRANSPRFDMLTGECRPPGFGGPPMRPDQALSCRLTAALTARLRDRQPFAAEDLRHECVERI